MRNIFVIIGLIFLTTYAIAKPTSTKAIQLFEAKKYKESIEIFKQQNTPESQYYLAKAYLYGLGVKKDLDKAFKYGKLSADSNYPAGINLLGVLFDYGYGVEKDKLQALVYYKKAAKLGNTKAMMNIGAMYAVGAFVKQDANQSIAWVKKAYKNGNVRAIETLGNLYASNEVQKYKEAIKFYNLYLNNKEADSTQISYVYLRLGDIYKNLDKKEQSISYYKKSADLNNTDAMEQLYFSYEIGATNRLEVLKYLASKKHPMSICALGGYYSNSLNSKYDYKKSYNILTTAIKEYEDTKVAGCYLDLAFLFETGHYVARDLNKAIELNIKYFNLEKKKPAFVARNIAEMYLKELKNYKKARQWYKITYELTKEKKYLTLVDKYIKSLPDYTKTKKQKSLQKTYPIINNFNKPQQILSILETKKYYFISTSLKEINMYDKQKLSLIKTLYGWSGKGIEGYTSQMAFDEHRKLLYCAGLISTTDFSKNDLIKVFNIKTGKIVNTINNTNSYLTKHLSISSDGNYLASIIQQNNKINIIDTTTNVIQHYDFSGREIFTKISITKNKKDYFVYALTKDNILYTFSINKGREVDKKPFNNQVLFKMCDFNHVRNIFKDIKPVPDIDSLNQTANKIYIKYNNEDIFRFNTKNLTVTPYNRLLPINNKHSPIIKAKIKKNDTILEVYNFTGKRLCTINTLSKKNVKILNYKIIDNKYILLITSDISMTFIFRLDGTPFAKLEDIQSIQTHLNYQNGRLITSGPDNIIHIFNLQDIDKLANIKPSYDMNIVKSFNKAFRGNVLDIFDETLDSEGLAAMAKGMHLTYVPTEKQIKNYFKLLLLYKQEIKPVVSLYIKNNDWIIYSPKGYFTSSKNGKGLIRYHLNQGLKKEAKIIDNEKIFEKFYRPDIIKKLLAKETVTDTLDIKKVLRDINAPSISMISNKLKDTKNLELTYQICDNGSGISNTSILVNNIQKNIASSRGFSIEKVKPDDKCSIYRNTITLQSGKNTIAIKSFDKSKTISTTTKAIEVTGKFDPPKKSNLYFLSIAVANYRDEDLRLKYPVSDVNAVKDKIKLHSKELFENIYTYDLHDSEVTQDKLDAFFDKIAKKITTNDVFILYIAGHGVTSVKNGLYYFLPYNITNTSSKGLINSAISVNNIKYQLGKINANKSLILLDTCDSGGAIDGLASRGLEQRMALERLSYATGRNYIVASSKSQAALEGYKEHGVFTYSVLQAFNKAYFGDDKILTVTSLASFIEKTVPQITKEKFHYEQFPQKYLNGNDFPIGLK